MNESTWWSSHVKPRWVNPAAKWLAMKVQDAFNAGLPDVDCIFNGAAAKIELKYAKAWPARPDTKLTFSKDKAQNLGGSGKPLVLSPGQEWFLYEGQIFDSHLNYGLTQAEMRNLAILNGSSYRDLIEVPIFLEARYSGK